MKFKLEIKCDNAAFADYPEMELARLLELTAHKLKNDPNHSVDCLIYNEASEILVDENGNKVGTYKLTD